MRWVAVLALILLVLASGCSQQTQAGPATGKVVEAGQTASNAEAQIEVKPTWAVYSGDPGKDTCPSQTCLEKRTPGFNCVPSHWCGVHGDPAVAGNKPFCCTKR